MKSSMAQSDQGKQWYLAVGERSIGPLTTDLVVRGIRSGKVPTTAWACQVGATQWSAISSFDEFQATIIAPLQRLETLPVQESDRSHYGQSPLGDLGGKSNEGDAGFDGAPSSVTGGQSRNQGGDSNESATPSSVMPAAAGVDRARGAENHDLDASGSAGSRNREAFTGDTEPRLCNNPLEHETNDVCTDVPSLLPYERFDAAPRHAESFRPDALAERSSLEFATSADAVLGSSYAALRADAGAPGFCLGEALDGERPGALEVGTPHDDLAIEITFDEAHEGSINWLVRFQSYFLVGTEVELPDEAQLLRSLRETPHHVFLHDEALWNLALCLAFGSDDVARSSAAAFFDAVSTAHRDERIEWICRTLLSKGFMPSGIPRCDGMRGIDMLRMACPLELKHVLEREAVD
jgi:hypothetical protein